MSDHFYDVIVIGGGHAACEAALASARVGAKTLMVAMNLDHIAQMSCNPCIGGVAKGHLVREIDALGGAMGAVADATAIQFKMLNRGKGPAVWSPRAQSDKTSYQRAMKRVLEFAENLTIHQAEAVSFLTENNTVTGIVTQFGEEFHSKGTVVATGTFLAGKLHYGLRNFPGGRAGDPPSDELAAALREQLKLHTGRLKTGTPPRILENSIDFSRMDVQDSECDVERFSFYPDESIRPVTAAKNMPCYMTHTGQEAAELVRNNLDKAPMYNGTIHGIGTRYCPSFEDKIVHFPDHERHHVYLEPEGEFTGEYYVNGLSTSLPIDIQAKILHSVSGLEKAVITRYAYAIEYDFVFPEELYRSFSVKKWKGLFLAGQINGTSGYEEAAGQGLLAGLNAARFAGGDEPVELGRETSYLGVLADDITTKEIVEPYRLFTSRAEHRLSLRQDNADWRLSDLAHQWNLLPEKRYQAFCDYRNRYEQAEALCRSSRMNGRSLWEAVHDSLGNIQEHPLAFDPVMIGLNPKDRIDQRIMQRLAIQAHYEGYMRQERQAVRRLQIMESWHIPEDFDYSTIPGLKNESRTKLMKIRPSTLSQAGRIDGVTPAELALLQIHIVRQHGQPGADGAVHEKQ